MQAFFVKNSYTYKFLIFVPLIHHKFNIMNQKIIRKISVGKDYPDGALHYQVGKDVNLKGHRYTVVNIVKDKELFALGILSHDIYISDGVDTILWKSVSDVPVVIETNIDFE